MTDDNQQESLDAAAEAAPDPVAPGPAEDGTVSDGAGAGPARDLGTLRAVLEALIFVHRGILPPKTVREVLGEEFSAEEIASGFAALKEEYERRGGALVLAEVAGGYQFATRPDVAPWIRKLDFYEHHRHLSRPALETLAIIAYKQPVTRVEIEAIRGVNVERIVRTLIERKLVRILGHKDVPGKPMVLGTTREFLELFGLNSLADLPPLKDFIEPPPDEGIDEEPQTAPEAVGAGDAGIAGSAADATGPSAGEGDDDTSEAGRGAEPETDGADRPETGAGSATSGEDG